MLQIDLVLDLDKVSKDVFNMCNAFDNRKKTLIIIVLNLIKAFNTINYNKKDLNLQKYINIYKKLTN